MTWLYKVPVPTFVTLTKSGGITEMLTAEFAAKYDYKPNPQEVTSWSKSLLALAQLLDSPAFRDTYIFLEFSMPLSSARCDVLLVGSGLDGKSNAMVVELKQWEHVSISAVRDSVAVGSRNYSHPSAQARSYARYLQYYHEAFTEQGIRILGCALLHNMTDHKSRMTLRDPAIFGTLPSEFPIFTRSDFEQFKALLAEQVGHGNGLTISNTIAAGGVKPSTKLLDVVSAAIQSNFEWRLLDEQLLVFNSVVSLVERAKSEDRKFLLAVRGGPGTGKSVLAIQLLAYAASHYWRVAHATGTKAFNTVLQAKTQEFSNAFLKRIYNARFQNQIPVADLFTTFADIAKLGSTSSNALDLVVGDEAHRLWDFRRNKYGNMNRQLSTVPMLEEIVRASRVTVLFLDDNQGVRADEIGSIDYIQDQAQRLEIDLELIDLNTQFRCAGSESYVNWVDHALGFSAHQSLAWQHFGEYDFQVIDSMLSLQASLDRQRNLGNRCRLVAGFCWKWSEIQGNGSLVHDLQDPRFNGWSAAWIEKGDQYAAPLDSRYYKWATDDSYYSQVGSIYSVQGFEFDYIGLIFGEDLVWRNNTWVANLSKNKDGAFARDIRATGENPVEKLRNVYRVLLTRGMKGTSVFFLDAETKARFQQCLALSATLDNFTSSTR